MRIPAATYRIQFTSGFGFRDAGEVLDYLVRLGITDVYASPVFQAPRGSAHGYDVADPTRLSEELGGREAFDTLARSARNLGLGWIQDFVPNHMAYHYDNPWMRDFLEKGPLSRFQRFFDVEPCTGEGEPLLAPFLGRPYAECLEAGEIRLATGPQGLTADYYDLRFPLAPASYTVVLRRDLSRLKRRLGADHPHWIRLQEILGEFASLSSPAARDWDLRMEQAKQALFDLYAADSHIREFIQETLLRFNGNSQDPESFSLLDDLLSKQNFRLAFWKTAAEEINYRRFFTINALVGLRVEDPDVFEAVHALLLEGIRNHWWTGVRVDHIDGLHDPTAYLQKLRSMTGDVYLVVEKILAPHEDLHAEWPVQGTTGYDFLNHLNVLFCDPEGEETVTRAYERFTGPAASYHEQLLETKRRILHQEMGGDLDNLVHRLRALAGRHRYGRDLTFQGLRRALAECMSRFPVYRTYLDARHTRKADRDLLDAALDRARRALPDLAPAFRFLEHVLLADPREEDPERRAFAMRLQQFTGPLMAKSFEDTFLYRYNRLLSLNEVGGDPGRFGLSVEAFHRFNQNRGDRWPHSLNATSTHDTKRSEDVRARINVLSELGAEWEHRVIRWKRINDPQKTTVKGHRVPDPNHEYALYQSLLGAYPLADDELPAFRVRIREYALKAAREAKVHTSWIEPDPDYEAALLSFVDSLLTPSEHNRFLAEFLPFQRTIAYYGMFNSLAQVLLKIASPGVPDFYQGSELWAFHLVDPDNRRAVDFDLRRALLEEILHKAKRDLPALVRDLLARKEDGRIKLFLTHRALHTRKAYRELFEKGAYVPLEVEGSFRYHVAAFARTHGGRWAVAVAPRFLTRLVREGEDPLGAAVWKDTRILLPGRPPERWKETITDRILPGGPDLAVGDVLRTFPVALLVNDQ